MSHSRTQIRAALTALLKGDGTATPAGNNVHPCRSLPLLASGLPAICVYDDSEKVESADATFPVRALEIKIECRAQHKSPEALEAALDSLALSVEAAPSKRTAAWADWPQAANTRQWTRTETPRARSPRAASPWNTRCAMWPPPAAQALENFETFHGDYTPGGFAGTEDTVELTPPEG